MKIAIRPISFRTLCMIAFTLLVVGVQAHAQSGCVDNPSASCAPEIDPSLASGGLALISGAVLLVCGRRRKQ